MKEFQGISIRISLEIFEELKKIAEKEHRSINQQINVYIEKGIAQQELTPTK